jgi:tetratricopeptide (TPR) repeat protein
MEREDSPWYPTMRLFRQSQPGDWAGVLDRMWRELPRWLGCSSAETIKLDSQSALAHFNLGITHHRQGQIGEAIVHYQQAISLGENSHESDFNLAAAYTNLGIALRLQGKLTAAIECYHHAIEINPNESGVYSNLANILNAQGNFAAAIVACNTALRLRPNFPEAYNNLGNAHQSQRNLTDAIACYQRAIALQPQDPIFHWNLGFALLLTGHFDRGWAEYQWRFQYRQNLGAPSHSAMWVGGAIPDRSLLLWGEQGLGDSIQFVRYAALLAAQEIQITIAVQPPLIRLFESCLIDTSVTVIDRDRADLSVYPVHTSLMNLPGVFQTNLGNIPASIPYIRAPKTVPPSLTLPSSAQLKIGIVWASSATNDEMYQKKSTSAAMLITALKPFLETGTISLWSLQVGQDAPQIQSWLPSSQIHDLSPLLTDFVDTASVIEQLDLVISVDTAVAHLAGAMGKPVWVLLPFLPDWRWLLEREDSPWYPTMRLFRQPQPGDWTGTLDRVVGELQLLLQRRSTDITQSKREYDRAYRLHRTGDLVAAIDCYQTAIQLNPNYLSAYVNLGIAWKQQGNLGAAIDCYQTAIQLNPNSAIAYNNLGNALTLQGQATDAAAAYQRAIEIQPDYPEACNSLGSYYQGIGNYDRAFELYQRAIVLKSDYAEAYNNLGNISQLQHKLDQAIKYYQQAIAVRPNYPEAYNNQGCVCRTQQKFNAAVASYQKAIELRSDYPEAYYNLSNVYADCGKLDLALAACQQALKLKPNYAAAYQNLGNILRDRGEITTAIAAYHQAIQLQPHYPEAHNNLGIAHQKQQNFTSAIAAYQQAISLNPEFIQPYNNLGVCYQKQGRLTEAIAILNRAIDLNPDYPEARWNLGLVSLLAGDFRTGWEMYEWRLLGGKMYNVPLSTPMWMGESLADQEILLWNEQGLGDYLQFVRYALLLEQQGARVTIATHPALIRLFQACLQLKFINILNQNESDLRGYQYHSSVMSLPRIFQTDFDHLPADIPYLRVNQSIPRALQLPDREKFKIGIVWGSARSNPEMYREKSISAELLIPGLSSVLNIGKISLYSLQVGEDAPQIQPWLKDENIHDLSHLITDFLDTAYIIEQLDLVITIDTSVAHLAGAMGKPVWILLPFAPDWRWLLEREDSPWYPTMRLFRQPQPGDWAGTLDRVCQAVGQIEALRSPSSLPPASLTAADYLQLGNQFRAKGQLMEAVTAYQQGISLQPDRAEIYNELGNIWQDLGQFTNAIDCYQTALNLQPQSAVLHYNLGTLLQTQGDNIAASASYQTAIDLHPDLIDAYINLGTTLRSQNQLAAAITVYQRALDRHLISPNIYYNLGNALKQQGDLEAAIDAYQQAISLQSNYPEAYANLGICFQSQGKFTEGITAYQRALQLQPDNPIWYTDLSRLFHEQGDTNTAISHCQQAIQLQPNYPAAYNHLGNLLREQGKVADAIAAYQTALSLQPNYPNARFNLSLALLLNGNFDRGWVEYRSRFEMEKPIERLMFTPQWEGGELTDLEILLWGEQGLGDGIQFMRYALLLAAQGAKVTLAVHPNLVRLFQECAIDRQIKVIDRGTVDRHAPITHVSLMSLPEICRTNHHQIPAEIPYLKLSQPIPDSLTLPPINGLNIGIVWGTSRSNPSMYRRKTIGIDTFLAGTEELLAAGKIHIWSLQIGDDAPEIQPWLHHPQIHDLSPQIADFFDTACIIEQLDLVITVDTAVAHLAGAMGKPVWVLLPFAPDWRWLLEREDSPWYPTMRLFRQSQPGNWETALEQVWAQLATIMASPHDFAIDIRATITPNYQQQGDELQAQGQLTAAESAYRQAIASQPDSIYARISLGNVLLAQRKLDDAVLAYQDAIALQPNDPRAYNNLSVALQQQGKIADAFTTCQRAIEIKPNYANAYINLGNLYKEQDRVTDAIAAYQRAIDLNPNLADAHNNLGNTLKSTGELTTAIYHCQRAIELQPNLAEAHNNLANILQAQGNLTAATEYYQRAITLKPSYSTAHWNYSFSLLLQGDFDRGWEEYEWRFRQQRQTAIRLLASPMWTGDSLLDRDILLWSEQGLGDSIQFVRYARQLQAQGARVTIATDPKLVRLFQECWLDHCPPLQIIDTQAVDREAEILHASLMSLPRLCGTNLTNIPADIPYLQFSQPIPDRLNLTALDSSPWKIGIVWGTSITNPELYAQKSISADLFLGGSKSLLATGQISLWSLQIGADAKQLLPWLEQPQIHDLSPLIADFVDTAAIIQQLDLVITVDTAVAHLAGAMGKPVWVLLPFLPDWRWLMEREDSPWYPTMRLFRQSQLGDWAGTLDRVWQQASHLATTTRS